MALIARGAVPEIVAELVRRYRVSKVQALRYVKEAQAARRPLLVPERNVVFTVKLPLSLVQRLRAAARSGEESISAMVARALEAFLQRGVGG